MKAAAAYLFVACCALLLLGPLISLFLGVDWSTASSGSGISAAGDAARLGALMTATVSTCAGTVALATLMGVVVALAIHRSSGWTRRIMSAAFPIPLLLPPVVVAVAWTHLLGKRGIAASIWTKFTGEPTLPFSIYGEWGSACVLALCWFPLVTLSTLVGLRAVGASAATAGRLYAPPLQRIFRIDLPLLLPYVSAGSVFVAWLALGDYDVPCVFLRNAFPMVIYNAFQGDPNIARALVLSIPLLALSAVVLICRQLLLRGKSAATIDTRWRAQEDDASGSRQSRWLLAGAVVVLILAVVMPIASLIHQTGSVQQLNAGLETAGSQVLNSFRTAGVAAALLLLVGAPYARILVAQRGWRRTALALLAIVPMAVPATLHGISWLQSLQAYEWGRALLTNPLIVSIADVARFFPFAVFLLAAAWEGLNPRLLGAAHVAGAGTASTWTRIAWPLVYPGVLAAFAITFALSIGDLGAAILLNPVGYSTLPVRLSSLLHFGKDELLAGLCLVQVFLALLPYLAAAVFLERTLEVRLG